MADSDTGEKTGKRLLLLIPFLLFIGFVIPAFFRITAEKDGDSADSIPNALAGKPAPRLILPLLLAPEGQEDAPLFDSDKLKGRVTLVNFWGSWCPPCREEHEFLLTLTNNPAFRLIGVNYKDSRENAARFLGQLGNPFAEIGFDESGRAAIDWGVYGPPETFILSKNGIILYRFIGPLNEQTFREKLLPIIKQANKEQ